MKFRLAGVHVGIADTVFGIGFYPIGFALNFFYVRFEVYLYKRGF